MQNEQWKPIVGFDDYEVCSNGTVRSNKPGRPRILNPRVVGAGYLQVVLYKNAVRHTRYVHVLVAIAFCERPEGTTEVNHKNLRKYDCRADNLEWSTHLANIRHARRNGSYDQMAAFVRSAPRFGKFVLWTGYHSRKDRRTQVLAAISK
jgi:hypothetical protein